MMNRETFLLEDRKKEIQDSFIKNGWITVYENSDADDNQILVYCCIVKNEIISQLEIGKIGPGTEGKPSIYST